MLLLAAVIIGVSGALTPSIVRSICGIRVATDDLEVVDVIVVAGWADELSALEATDLQTRNRIAGGGAGA